MMIIGKLCDRPCELRHLHGLAIVGQVAFKHCIEDLSLGEFQPVTKMWDVALTIIDRETDVFVVYKISDAVGLTGGLIGVGVIILHPTFSVVCCCFGKYHVERLVCLVVQLERHHLLSKGLLDLLIVGRPQSFKILSAELFSS